MCCWWRRVLATIRGDLPIQRIWRGILRRFCSPRKISFGPFVFCAEKRRALLAGWPKGALICVGALQLYEENFERESCEVGGVSAGRVAGIAEADAGGGEGGLSADVDRRGVSVCGCGELCVAVGGAADVGCGAGAGVFRSAG